MNVSGKNDQALLDEFVVRGCDKSFAELARRHQAMAFAAAYRICGDRAEAQDILQQALIVLARRARELGEVRCLSAWLHRVVILEAKKARRKAVNRRLRETMACQIDELAQNERDLSRKIAPVLDESLDGLELKDRQVLTLHYLEGLTFARIAEKMGGTSEAWQKRSRRALEKLSGKLKRRGVSVTTIVLTTCLTTYRTEAGVNAAILERITREAIDQSLRNSVAGALGKTVVLLSMKTGILISLTSGMLLAYGWTVVHPQEHTVVAGGIPAKRQNRESDERSSARERDGRGFTLELVRQVVGKFDLADRVNPLEESRLRVLMFLVPENHLEAVLQILLETENHERFMQIAGALFGRWAEFDPAGALARSVTAGGFSHEARRAVMITWLNSDETGALEVMRLEKSGEDRGFLTEFVSYQSEHRPQEAAELVDRIAKEWPEANEELLELVAKRWSESDGLAAGDWVAAHPEGTLRLRLLKELAVSVAKTKGFDGLAIADHIEDPKARDAARFLAINWWAVTAGGRSIKPEGAEPNRDLSGGFPDDWTDRDIRVFAFGTMVNYSDQLGDLLRIAKDDGQKSLIYLGTIQGACWSNPAAVTLAAEQLPDSYAQTREGKETLQTYIRRWNEMDAKAAESWLSEQAPGLKVETMRAALEEAGAKR